MSSIGDRIGTDYTQDGRCRLFLNFDKLFLVRIIFINKLGTVDKYSREGALTDRIKKKNLTRLFTEPNCTQHKYCTVYKVRSDQLLQRFHLNAFFFVFRRIKGGPQRHKKILFNDDIFQV